MKYIKLFENYFSDLLDRIINDMKSHKIGDVINKETLYNYVSALHGFDLENDFIEDFISSKNKFTLAKLKISEIDLDSVSQDLVDEYKQEYRDSSWYPPILYSTNDEIIIDGYHRAKMVDDLKEDYILAWI